MAHYPPSKGPACEKGNCTCNPPCAAQGARVEEFLMRMRSRAEPPTLAALAPPSAKPAIPGHVWLCASCRQALPEGGVHCGFRMILVEEKGLDKDSQGRITRATAADIPSLYRKAPPGSLDGWKKSGTGA